MTWSVGSLDAAGLKKWREDRDMTLTEAGVAVGLCRETMWRLENNYGCGGRPYTPSRRTRRALALFFGEIIGGIEIVVSKAIPTGRVVLAAPGCITVHRVAIERGEDGSYLSTMEYEIHGERFTVLNLDP